MKFVPDIPPPASGADGLSIKAPTAGTRIKSTLPRKPAPSLKVTSESEPKQDKRQNPHGQQERRTYCRRIIHLPVLIELRSHVVRRQHKQRATDPTEHVDLKV